MSPLSLLSFFPMFNLFTSADISTCHFLTPLLWNDKSSLGFFKQFSIDKSLKRIIHQWESMKILMTHDSALLAVFSVFHFSITCPTFFLNQISTPIYILYFIKTRIFFFLIVQVRSIKGEQGACPIFSCSKHFFF